MKKFTSLHRLLHWGIAVGMFVLLITGFYRVIWLGRKAVGNIIQSGLAEKGINVERSDLRNITSELINPWFQRHTYAAYWVLVLYVIRMCYTFKRGIVFPNPFSAKFSMKERFQGSIYIIFYLLLFVQIFTGFYMAWGGIEFKQPLETVHKWAVYWTPIFIGVHFIGILIAENSHGKDKGVVSKMIGGE